MTMKVLEGGYYKINPFIYGGIIDTSVTVMAKLDGAPLKPTTVEHDKTKKTYFIDQNIVVITVKKKLQMKGAEPEFEYRITWLCTEKSGILEETVIEEGETRDLRTIGREFEKIFNSIATWFKV